MTQHAEIRILPYSAEQMFNLVADVEKYPLFLPWCQSARIISRNENSFIADLTIGYKSFTHTFRSHVFLNEPAEIRVDYLGGQMKHLKNHWKFCDLSNGHSEIDFLVDFSFGSGFLQTAVETIFAKAVSQMIQAFKVRAKSLYGT
jgi:coenzyme Q-binding protein COQ10